MSSTLETTLDSWWRETLLVWNAGDTLRALSGIGKVILWTVSPVLRDHRVASESCPLTPLECGGATVPLKLSTKDDCLEYKTRELFPVLCLPSEGVSSMMDRFEPTIVAIPTQSRFLRTGHLTVCPSPSCQSRDRLIWICRLVNKSRGTPSSNR